MNSSQKILHANIHRPDEKMPMYADESTFFKHAVEIEKIESKLTSFVSGRRTAFEYKTAPFMTPFVGPKSRGQVLDISLSLPHFPNNVSKPQILIFDTPENNAMTIGRLALDKNQLQYQVARFHTGILAQDDLSIAMQAAAQAPQLQKLFGAASSLPERMYITYLTREGHLTDWHRAMYYSFGITVPFTVVHAEHAQNPDVKAFARVTKICPVNLEGLVPDKIEILVMGDNTASGMQQVAVLEEVIQQIKQKNDGQHHLKQLLIISPLLTLYSAGVISQWAAVEEHLPVTFIASGAILGCNPPDRYFSPVLNNPDLIANPKLLPLNQAAYGQAAGTACVRCNWTASFMAPAYAEARSEEELAMYGSTNAKVREQSAQIDVKKLDVPTQDILPYSTWQEAARLGKLEVLKSMVR